MPFPLSTANILRVEGASEDVQSFFLKHQSLDFNAIVPMPEKYQNKGYMFYGRGSANFVITLWAGRRDPDDILKELTQWISKNWGCMEKSYERCKKMDTTIEYMFETRYPPNPLIKSLAKQNKHLKFEHSFGEIDYNNKDNLEDLAESYSCRIVYEYGEKVSFEGGNCEEFIDNYHDDDQLGNELDDEGAEEHYERIADLQQDIEKIKEEIQGCNEYLERYERRKEIKEIGRILKSDRRLHYWFQNRCKYASYYASKGIFGEPPFDIRAWDDKRNWRKISAKPVTVLEIKMKQISMNISFNKLAKSVKNHIYHPDHTFVKDSLQSHFESCKKPRVC